MFTVQVTERHVGADIAASGARLPYGDPNEARTFYFRHYGPSFDDFTDDDGHLDYSCGSRQADDVPFMPAWMAREIRAHATRYARGSLQHTPEQVAIRENAARRDITRIHDLPPKGVGSEADARTPVIDGLATELLDAYALPTDIVVSLVRELVSGATAAEATERVAAMANEPKALWPWDEKGRQEDMRIQAERAAEARRTQEEAERAARDAAPNAKTCHELGIFMTRRRVQSQASILAPHVSAMPRVGPGFTMLPQFMPAAFCVNGFYYFAFKRDEKLMGLTPPTGPFRTNPGEFLPLDFVPPCSTKQARELLTLNVTAPSFEAIIQERRGALDEQPAAEMRDLRSPEGAWAVGCIEQTVKPFAAEIRLGGLHFNVAVHAYARTNIRRDVAWQSLTAIAGNLNAEQFNIRFDQALAGGTVALFGFNELYTEPPESFLDKVKASPFWSWLVPDKWTAALQPFTKRRGAPVFTDEIENSLRDKGLIAGTTLVNDDALRIGRIMRRAGKEKKQVTIDGKRRMAWVDKWSKP